MVDWRAPEAGAFYQATAFERQGVRRRRHLILKGREVKAIEDDVLDASMLTDAEQPAGRGRAAGRAEFQADRPDVGHRRNDPGRTGPDHPRPMPGVLVVQGGPGTGKTAVALHRAAYLLYMHRERLKSPACCWSARRIPS